MNISTEIMNMLASWHVTTMIWREVITELSVMKIYLNSHKQRLGVTSLSARLLSLGTLPPSRSRPNASGLIRLLHYKLLTDIHLQTLLFQINFFTNHYEYISYVFFDFATDSTDLVYKYYTLTL